MEKSNDSSREKPDEQIQENGIENGKVEGTSSKLEPSPVGLSDNTDANVMDQPVGDAIATRSSNGEGSCSLTPDEIKQIVANFLGSISAENTTKGPSEVFNGKESADHGIKEFTHGESSKYKCRFSSGNKKKTSSKLSRKKTLKSGSRSSKTLQSRGGNVVPEPTTNVENKNPAAHAGSSKERRKRKKKKLRENTDDVFTKIRKQVRYTLNKVQYEQSLIDAYGGEGWKGLSIDKLKPEKELQRATSEILRCKLRLRDLFQRLDNLCAEGSYPESMFDSEGLLDSEDIYCTICGSRELSADNDIVLCDGECNRAFHQMCLKPPLLTEKIPPDDQGWLCPGCDCKFDCTEMLNDFFGTNLSMKDNWTSIFPEAATAAAGASIQDEILGLPSDDSEDDDFDPENMDVDGKVDADISGEGRESSEGEAEESTSDESDFSSDSEDLGDFINKEQLEKNPLDNSEEEDDDYNPDVPEPDEQIKEESSNSDFTSASDDFLPEADNVTSVINEVLAAAEMEQESLDPGSKKRDIERLDYKKLYDETYGNASSDSSDDEEWTEVGPSRKRKNKNERDGSTLPKNNTRASEDDDEKSMDAERKLQETEYSTPPRSGKKLKSCSGNGSMSKGSRSSLGETATQKLNEAFQINQYPERAVKENLAKELGIPYQKVDKWFGNARWSFNHPIHARTVSKSNISKTSLAVDASGSKASIINNSSENNSSQNLLDAETTVNDRAIKISPSSKPKSLKAASKPGQRKKLRSPNSSATVTPIQGDASQSPPLQSNKRRSARFQETQMPYNTSSKAEVNKDNTNNGEGSAIVGDSSKQKVTTPTPNSKSRGKKVVSSGKKAAPVSKIVDAQKSGSTAVENMQNNSSTRQTKKAATKLFPGNQESLEASSTKGRRAGTKEKSRTRSKK